MFLLTTKQTSHQIAFRFAESARAKLAGGSGDIVLHSVAQVGVRRIPAELGSRHDAAGHLPGRLRGAVAV